MDIEYAQIILQFLNKERVESFAINRYIFYHNSLFNLILTNFYI